MVVELGARISEFGEGFDRPLVIIRTASIDRLASRSCSTVLDPMGIVSVVIVSLIVVASIFARVVVRLCAVSTDEGCAVQTLQVSYASAALHPVAGSAIMPLLIRVATAASSDVYFGAGSSSNSGSRSSIGSSSRWDARDCSRLADDASSFRHIVVTCRSAVDVDRSVVTPGTHRPIFAARPQRP